jgi:uncharacterized protein YndB with AHSA1/START domain
MPSVTREITLPVDPEEAWADVSESERLTEWIGEDVELDPWEGGEVRIGDREGTVSRVDPGRRLAFTVAEPATEIVFSVEPVEGGTRVRVTESGPVLVGPRLQAMAHCPA